MATEKQKLAASIALKKPGAPLGEIMREAGYSEATSNLPQALTESNGWKELMEEYLPDKLLASKHKALLNKMDKEGEIDTNAVGKALDMAYKLKGKNAPEKTIHLNIDVVSDDDLILAQHLLEQRRNKTSSIESHGTTPELMGGEAQN